MSTKQHAFRLLSETISVDRIRDGELQPTDIVVVWADHAPDTHPTLTVHQRWSDKQCRFLETTRYHVAEIPVGDGFDGRAFHLTKLTTNDAGDEVPTSETYDAFVCRHDANNICDCKGHYRHGHCKHVDAMRFIIEQGVMDIAAETLADEPLYADDPFAGVDLTPTPERIVQPGELAYL